MSAADVKTAKPRAGSTALLLFAVPLNGLIVRALADGPMRLSELRRAVGGPAQTTLRGNLATLIEIGALAKRGRDDRPNVLENELTPLGHELLRVGDALEAWLSRAPEGPIAFESAAAKAAIKALVGGWDSTIVRALAARPLTLTDLDRLIDTFTYPALERRLGAMRLANQIELCPDGDRKRRPYTVSPWLREAIGPMAVAVRCERRHLAAQTAPIGRIDIESAFLLSASLLRLDPDTSGICQLTVEARGVGPGVGRSAGVQIEVEEGRVVACVARIEAQPANWATGPVSAWMRAVIEREPEELDFGGDVEIASELVCSIHDALFGSSKESPAIPLPAAG